MKVFRPAAGSISLGCREFNLCLFLVWNSCVLLCVFSRFFFLLTCVVLPLPFSWSSLLVFASVCVCVGVCLLLLLLLLSAVFLLCVVFFVSCQCKSQGNISCISTKRHWPKTVGYFRFFLFPFASDGPPPTRLGHFFRRFFVALLRANPRKS